MLDIAFAELSARRPQNQFTQQLRTRMDQRHGIL
jgi:hypothetical protein